MEFKAEQKYARISPTKVRPLVLFVKPMGIDKVLEMLPLVPNKAASVLLKVVKAAVANAIQKGFTVSDLIFKEIIVNEGPRLKRGRPVSRGMWHPYTRRTSHIKVILETRQDSKFDSDDKTRAKEVITQKKDVEVKSRKDSSLGEKVISNNVKKRKGK